MKVQVAVLHAIRNLTTGTDKQLQLILDNGAVTMVERLLTHPENEIKKGAIRFISNITATNRNNVQTTINENLILLIIGLLECKDIKTQKAASQTVFNIIVNGTVEHISYMVDHNLILLFCNLLSIHDTQMIKVVLNGLKNILEKITERTKEICESINKCGGLDKIKCLQNYYGGYICKLANAIIDRFFPSNGDENFTLEDTFLCNNVQDQIENNSNRSKTSNFKENIVTNQNEPDSTSQSGTASNKINTDCYESDSEFPEKKFLLP